MNIFSALFPLIYEAVTRGRGDTIKEVSSILQLKDDNIKKEEIQGLLHYATPEQLMQLKKLENDTNELHLKNTISARKMNISNKEKFLPILGLLTVFTSFLMVAYLFRFGVPENNKAIVYTLMGNILAWPTMILNFYYGSSMGSREKNQIISDLQKDPIA